MTAADTCAFVLSQADALCDGLRHADDPGRLAIAVAAHDAGRERWLALLAEQDGPADELASLHALHRRLARSLERGLDGWFRPEAARLVRVAQADHLAASTAAAVDHVRSSDERRGERPWLAPTGFPTPSTKRSAPTRRAAPSATV